MTQPADLIGGRWEALSPSGVGAVVTRNPARPERVVWSGVPVLGHVDRAVSAARSALPAWSRWPIERRASVLQRFKAMVSQRQDEIAKVLREEIGKVGWDAKAEAALLANKVDITLDGGPDGSLKRVTGYSTKLAETREGRCWFRPHGVMAVLGPYNFPVHLPNGHIVPALLMGNTVVFKPSGKAAGSGALLAKLYQEALDAEGAPPGVLNLVQGEAETSKRLAGHEDVDGVLFTGSWPVGRAIMQANLDRPGRVLALEMGGNNAAVIMPDADLSQAVIECVRSAFISTGQRCTCTRRVVVHEAVADRVIRAIGKATGRLIIGDPEATHPVFMGPIITDSARQAVLEAQRRLAAAGGQVLLEATAVDGPTAGGWYLSPGVMRVERFVAGEGDSCGGGAGEDVEVFGPFLRIAVVRDFDEAVDQANATRYGLAASIFTRDARQVEEFLVRARAGCVNVNTGTAGASSKLPFGGLGLSGNHRPAGAFSLDYCAYPVAGMLERGPAATLATGMSFDPSWVA